MRKSHHSNKAVRDYRKLSVNMVDETMPIINDSPLVMECIVENIYETETFDNFICKIANTYAKEEILD